MALLGLELSDAGIIVAGGEPARLLEVDGHKDSSPGFAIPEKKDLLVGISAAAKAHLFPLQVITRFWDQLNTAPLEHKSRHAQNHAEIACAHLAHIWDNVKQHGDEMIIAVPDYYGREQLGLILGMAQEWSIPVKGFVSLAVAASSEPYRDAMLLHIDLHLHRFEIVYLHQGEHLSRQNALTVQDISLEHLYRNWVESIAAEFVSVTRFDPLHQAATEQELYNHLPAALDIFKSQTSFLFEISHAKHNYRITLPRDLLIQKSAGVYAEIRRLVESMRDEHSKNGALIALQLSHRTACLPGLVEKLSEIDNCEIIQLQPGAGALGVLQLERQVTDQNTGDGAFFFTSRPWQAAKPQAFRPAPSKTSVKLLATHLLYNDVAYPLSPKPIIIGDDEYPDGKSIRIRSDAGISKKHCTVQRSADMIILTDYSHQGTFVDDQRVDGSTILAMGQIIRLGTSDETLRLIACMDTDET